MSVIKGCTITCWIDTHKLAMLDKERLVRAQEPGHQRIRDLNKKKNRQITTKANRNRTKQKQGKESGVRTERQRGQRQMSRVLT